VIRVLIADDESPARQRLRALVEDLPGGASVIECGDGADAVSILREQEIDLVFLDIRMPELDGVEVVRRVGPAAMPPTIFVTAHGEYAVTAFELRVADYLLKPFDEERVRDAIEHALARGRAARGERLTNLIAERPPLSAIARIAVRQNGKFMVVPVSEVVWLEAADNHVRLHSAGTLRNDLLRVRGKLTAFEARLEASQFVRIHRSAIVNLTYVREIVPWFHGDQKLVLSTGEELSVSRRYSAALLERLGVARTGR
jgi:two-component system, LytTR family, response regulator